MNEPDWSKYQLDDLTQPPGQQLEILKSFMLEFVSWRLSLQQTAKAPKKKGRKK